MKTIFFKIIITAFIIFFSTNYSFSEDGIISKNNLFKGNYISIQLENDDIISGKINDFISDKDYGEGIKLDTEIGEAMIFEYQIKKIISHENTYRYNNRSIFLPTAYPIEDDHFIGLSELALINAGFGITKYFSIMGAHSVIPGATYDSQIFYLNGKVTFFNDYIDKNLGKLALAGGVNIARIGKESLIWHGFLGASLNFNTTTISANLFYKFGGQDLYDYRYRDFIWTYGYTDGSFGLSLALDKQISEKGLHVFVEIINNDFTNYKKTSITSGIRFSNHKFGADLGLGLFGGQPLPIMQFFWTPF